MSSLAISLNQDKKVMYLCIHFIYSMFGLETYVVNIFNLYGEWVVHLFIKMRDLDTLRKGLIYLEFEML